MSRVVPYAITLLGLACMAFIVVGISQPVPHPETYLAVTDKPYVVAEVAQEEAEAEESRRGLLSATGESFAERRSLSTA